jgi:hypothetical protein
VHLKQLLHHAAAGLLRLLERFVGMTCGGGMRCCVPLKRVCRVYRVQSPAQSPVSKYMFCTACLQAHCGSACQANVQGLDPP